MVWNYPTKNRSHSGKTPKTIILWENVPEHRCRAQVPNIFGNLKIQVYIILHEIMSLRSYEAVVIHPKSLRTKESEDKPPGRKLHWADRSSRFKLLSFLSIHYCMEICLGKPSPWKFAPGNQAPGNLPCFSMSMLYLCVSNHAFSEVQWSVLLRKC